MMEAARESKGGQKANELKRTTMRFQRRRAGAGVGAGARSIPADPFQT